MTNENEMNEQQANDELKDIAPTLSKMKSGEGFSVPPAYFKELRGKVLNQIHNEQKQKASGSWLHELIGQYFKPRFALVLATFTIVIVAGIVLMRDSEETILLASITSEDAYEYVYDNIRDYESIDLFTIADINYDGTLFDNISDEELNNALDALINDIGDTSIEELL